MSQPDKWALISVCNKTGICEFAQELVGLGWKIMASGGTAKALTEAEIHVKDVAELVGGDAILKHRVVTLSRELHAGLLADKKDPEQVAEMEKLGLPIIDMVVCDFYPLRDAIAKPGATVDSVVELTDIGGPTMVRSAAKGGRIVVCRFEDRQRLLTALQLGHISPSVLEELRARAEFEVARYCMDSARFHSAGGFEGFFGELTVNLPKGENGYQTPAALYKDPDVANPFGLDKYLVLDGVPLSYNNYTDIDRLYQTMLHILAAWSLNFRCAPYIAVGVKHGNACAAAVGTDVCEVVRKAAIGDNRAMFGGLMMCNFPLDGELAKTIVTSGMNGRTQKFDSVIATGFNQDAMRFFQRKGGRCRIVRAPFGLGKGLGIANKLFRQVEGGFLVQPGYGFVPDFSKMQVCGVPGRDFTKDLALAIAVGSTSNSNTITIANNGMLLGNGVGQHDRVGAAELAIKRARDAGHDNELEGASAYSDSFFPYPDAPKVLIDAGIQAIFSTSGSINDKLTHDLCRERGVILYQMPDSEARGFFRH